MRQQILAACIAVSLCACASREKGGFNHGRELKPCPIVVLPIADAQRRHVRVFGTGHEMTDEVVRDLAARGFKIIRPDGDSDDAIRAAAKAGGARVVLTALFAEWDPDLNLVLQASDMDNGDLISWADCAVGSSDMHPGESRRSLLPKLAHAACGLLVNPPREPQEAGRDAQRIGMVK